MNRVHPPHASHYFSPSSESSSIKPHSKKRSLLSSSHKQSKGQSLFIPEHYEPKYAYPLILWLHNQGHDERQLNQIMPKLSLRNFVAVGIRGTASLSPLGDLAEGFAWLQESCDIEQAGLRAFEAVEQAQARFNIAPGRIFIGGFEEGGTMAMRLALLHPDFFAGAFSVGGALPQGEAPLRAIEQARRLPLLLGHTRESQRYNEARICQDLRLLHSAGINVSIRQYPGGDTLTDNMLGDANRWMMEQITGVPAEEEESSHLNCISRN